MISRACGNPALITLTISPIEICSPSAPSINQANTLNQNLAQYQVTLRDREPSPVLVALFYAFFSVHQSYYNTVHSSEYTEIVGDIN